jgi:hypothetical protein
MMMLIPWYLKCIWVIPDWRLQQWILHGHGIIANGWRQVPSIVRIESITMMVVVMVPMAPVIVMGKCRTGDEQADRHDRYDSEHISSFCGSFQLWQIILQTA